MFREYDDIGLWSTEIIETYWNVNMLIQYHSETTKDGNNRNILECK